MNGYVRMQPSCIFDPSFWCQKAPQHLFSLCLVADQKEQMDFKTQIRTGWEKENVK